MNEDQRWYAVSVKHQHERLVEGLLTWQGLETLAPVYSARRNWSDRVQDLELPLFAGYIFCRIGRPERMRVEDTPGVARIVGFGGRPTPVEDIEIAAIRAVMASKLPVRPWPHLVPGDRVRMERGPLRGIEGILLKEKDNLHLVIGVELLQRSVAVEVEPLMVSPMGKGQTPGARDQARVDGGFWPRRGQTPGMSGQ